MDGLLAPDLFSLETFVAKRGLRSNALYPYPPVSAATIWNNPLVTLELFYGPNCSSGMCFPEMTARRKNMEDRAQCLAGLQEQPTASIHHHLPLWPKHRQGGDPIWGRFDSLLWLGCCIYCPLSSVFVSVKWPILPCLLAAVRPRALGVASWQSW